ncbi:MAG TPA: transcription elongation factor GreA [Candidatus Omnitrophota bacterium]|mgnify:CR=1 FL=1|nr:transcription elongation factor GreA [Candidatus Omnitrophota bacterium]HPB68411.1 transcription elongation factor GreA [Candidatus Omnitrophota bacterium]HQO57275.1 transcription elongation factor GreA [Candidatus Omnitrophota bacterium]HQP11312.1 transcription elongation factor GreA [Candidatus Omnitrophota bacterium]
MSQEVYLTKAGYEKMIQELDHLKNVERRRISQAIGEARLQGDLSENAEYDAAKDAQAHCEARIAELESKLANVRIIESQNISADKVYIGAVVTLRDMESEEELQYMMVSPEEANYEENKLSIFSPIGKGLLGKGQGEELAIQVPAGTLKYKILKIERP